MLFSLHLHIFHVDLFQALFKVRNWAATYSLTNDKHTYMENAFGFPAIIQLPVIVQLAKVTLFCTTASQKKKSVPLQSVAVGRNNIILIDCRRLQVKIDCRESEPMKNTHTRVQNSHMIAFRVFKCVYYLSDGVVSFVCITPDICTQGTV